MAEEIVEQETLRDTIEAAFDEHVEAPEGAALEKPAPASEPAPEGASAAPEGATADRPRGPDGKFIPKEEAAAAAPAAAAPKASAAPAVPPEAAPAPASHGLARPSSWKKDYEEKWGKLDPDLAKYILQRESEFASGVSTYKREYDNARPLMEAMQPFMPLLQQHGIQPGQWIGNLGRAHQTLATGSPEQKLGMFMKLASDYQVPLQQLFQQGQDGKVYFNPQVQAYQPPPQQAQQPDVRRTVQEILSQERVVQALADFEREAPTKYQHYETVKETMARLLEAGLAQDYPDAYNRALRQPEHEAIWNAQQEQQRQAKAAEDAKRKAAEVARARSQAVSVRSATPASQGAPAGKKGLRGTLEDAFDQHAGADRV